MKRFLPCLLLALVFMLANAGRAGIGLGGGLVNVLGNTNVMFQTNTYQLPIPAFSLTLGNVTNANSVFIGTLNATILSTNLGSFTNIYSAGAGTNGMSTNFPSVVVSVQVISVYSAATGTNTIPVQAN